MKALHFESIDSTNNYLKQNYKNLENYTFVSADQQTNGKGRNQREWKSENSKNLLFSLLLLDKQLFDHYKEISIITAYSIIEELEKIGLKNLSIKWPNDVYVNDKKICGILLESISANETECLIVGVGLNINQEMFKGEYRIEPTSVFKEINIKQDINVLKDNIYNFILNNIKSIKENKSFYNEINKYDYLKNKEVVCEINSIKKEVKVIGIQEDFSLLVEDKSILISLYSGEIESIKIK